MELKADIDNLRDQIKLVRGKIITENLINNTTNIIRSYFVEKGFLNVEISTSDEEDPNTPNHVLLTFKVDKKERVKIRDIFKNNTLFADKKLKRLMKDTKEKHFYRLFKASKFLENAYDVDKNNIIAKYNEKGIETLKLTVIVSG